MRLKFTLITLFFISSFFTKAQNVTGIWQGYFIQNTFGIYQDKYRFEVQIAQADNNGVKGVTYSYKTTVFYGKADIQGLFTQKTNNLIINETRLSEVKITDNSDPCLMTCYLEFNKMGSMETLTGTYTSRNAKTGKDCGSGKVFLERTLTSDFGKEDFLVKRENELKRKSIVRTPRTKPAPPAVDERKAPAVKPGAEDNLISKENKLQKIALPKVEPQKEERPVEKLLPPKPDVIKRRGSELVKTVFTGVKDVKIEIYDNGEIDGDTISVYHNNELIISKKRLTDKPITYNLKPNEGNWTHEFVLVADNLGSIPPNTALMVVTAGDKRYELFISSNEKKNAVVVIEYKPEE